MNEEINDILFFSKRLNLLFVEGDSDNNEILGILKNIFFTIESKKITDAFYSFMNNKYDLIIVNIVNKENLRIINSIRKVNQNIPILVLSEFNDPEFIIESLKIFVSGFLLKPIIYDQCIKQLLKTINDIKLNYNNFDSINKFNHALTLVKEYELAINESNILSRANLDGIITYANKKFCEVSGYSEEELIGNKHNIIRHPDTSSKVFENIWQTITDGKIWKGVIKNRNKNGESYWVNTTIIPIHDKNDNITEYMAIRHNLSEVFSLHGEIEDTQREIIYRMGEVCESRSKETGQHVKRVAQYSKDLALLFGLSKKESEILFIASPMHDIGKVGIPDEILKKPGKLTADEFEIMKTHSEIGFNILKGSSRQVLKAASIISLTHHEKYDGTGYPNSLKGEDIHIYGRITAIADVFDALGSDRIYKKAWEDEKVTKFLIDEKGKSFDPQLVDIFINNIDIFYKTRDSYKDE